MIAHVNRSGADTKTSLVFITIVVAQFCGTSLWFAGNAILPQLQRQHHWPDSALGHLTGIVQLGFITGTFLFASLGIADRFSPSRIFLVSCFAGALFNLLALVDTSSFLFVLISRGLAGFCLAGIYPIGMKIAADWNEQGLGHWLGMLVGALVLGTAFPHSLKLVPQFIDAENLLIAISSLAVLGGLLLWIFVPDGPYRKRGTTFSIAGIREAFRSPSFRSPALGYFGHMWELYAFWAFVPWALRYYSQVQVYLEINVALWSFVIIAAGAAGCIAGGIGSFRIGSDRVALYALSSSAMCCLINPLLWYAPPVLFFAFMIFWGIAVVADSPQFSTLVARSAPAHIRGSAITIVTCIGFAITIVSIQLLNALQDIVPEKFLLTLLLPGPVLGIFFLVKKMRA